MAIPLEDAHEAWTLMRKNLTERDLYPKRSYPMWTNPATGKPCRSAPAPFGQQAPPLRAVSTADPNKNEHALARQLGVRQRLNRRLTDIQKRRLLVRAEKEVSYQEIATIEDVNKSAVRQSVSEAYAKLEQDIYLWLLWLL